MDTRPAQPLQPQDLSSLLHDLYASATDDFRLQRFLAHLCAALGANIASVSLSDHDSGRWRYVDCFPADRGTLNAYETYYAEDDPVKARLLSSAPNQFHTADQLGAELTPDVYAAWRRHYLRLNFGDLCAAHFPLDEHYTCMIGMAREHAAPAFTVEDLALLDLLLPHIVQLLSIHARIDRLRLMSDVAQEQFARLGAGCITLNEDRRVNFINLVAREILHEANGIILREGTLHLTDAQANARFQQLQKTCVTVSRLPTVMGGSVLAVSRTSALPLNIAVISYRFDKSPHSLLTQANHVIVLIFDPARPRAAAPAILRELYPFSEDEATVCWRLANGESLDQIAAAEGISKETVRSQLKRIFAKTGTNRQIDLVRLVLLGPAAFGSFPGNGT